MILTLQHLINGTDLPAIQGGMSWDEAFDAKDHRALQIHIATGETAEMMERILAMTQKKVPKSPTRGIRWADEVSVTGSLITAAPATASITTVPIAVVPITIMPITTAPIATVPIDDGFQVVSKAPVKVDNVNPRKICTLVARNLPRTITEIELRHRFSAHGTIQRISIPKNTTPGKYFGTIKGFALIKYNTHKYSTKAFLAEKGLFLGENAVTLEFANEDR